MLAPTSTLANMTTIVSLTSSEAKARGYTDGEREVLGQYQSLAQKIRAEAQAKRSKESNLQQRKRIRAEALKNQQGG